jgi:hypothetical protein
MVAHLVHTSGLTRAVPGVYYVIDNTVPKTVKHALGGEFTWAANGDVA